MTGKLRLTQIAEKASDLSALSTARKFGGAELLRTDEIFADKAALKLKDGITDYDGRRLQDLVKASMEIDRSGVIQAGVITTDKIADNAVTAAKAHSDFGTTGDRILASSDTMFETTSTSYQLAWTVHVEALEDVKNVIEYVKAQIRVGPSSGGGSPPPPDSEISCPT